jgi:cytochrome P450
MSDVCTRVQSSSVEPSPMPPPIGRPGGQYYVVRDPEAVREVFNRVEDFSSSNALIAVTPLTASSLRVLQRAGFALPPVLASNDAKSHKGIRQVVAGFFTPSQVANIEPRFRDLLQAAVATAVHQLRTGKTVDLRETVASYPPAVLMLEMLGLPICDVPQLKVWSRQSLELFWGWPDNDRQLCLAASVAEFYSWLQDFISTSLAAPGRNIFTSLAEHGLRMPELCSLGYFLLIAAQETTTQLISTTLFRLLDNTAAVSWHDAASRTGATAAVHNVLITESSGPTARRIVRKDTFLGEQFLPIGAEILLELTGNHGFEPKPTAFSLAFGSGMHRCIGAKLAVLEATIAVQETAAALPSLCLTDPTPAWMHLLSFRSPQTITVTRQ